MRLISRSHPVSTANCTPDTACQVVRLQGIQPLATLLTQSYSSFLDEKDRNGSLILSHVYLLVGLSVPLWILNTAPVFTATADNAARGYCEESSLGIESTTAGRGVSAACYDGYNKNSLLLLSGVLSVGIGDTFASVCGIMYGKTRWPGTKKTVVGTCCGVVAEVVVIAALWLSGGITVPAACCSIVWWTGVVSTVVMCALVEAFTDQVDNIVLPILMFVGFSVTQWVS